MSPCQNKERTGNIFFQKIRVTSGNSWEDYCGACAQFSFWKFVKKKLKKKMITKVVSPARVFLPLCFTMLGGEGWRIYIQTASGNWFQLLGRPAWECQYRTGRGGFRSPLKAEEVRETGPTSPPQPEAHRWPGDQCLGLEPGSCWPSRQRTGTRTVLSSVGSRDCPDSGWPNRPDSKEVLRHKKG